MVGWSRRNAESRARRARWWASLTEEEKRRVRVREAESDRKFFLFCKFFFPAMLLLLLLTIWKSY